MEIYGPSWHSSEERRKHDYKLTQSLAPQIEVELYHATSLSKMFGYGEITDIRVDTFDIVYKDGDPHVIVTNDIPIKKLQTLARPDMPLLEGKQCEQQLHPLLKFQRDTALDEAPQLTQLTHDPEEPGVLSLVGVRAQQVSELQLTADVLHATGHKDLLDAYCRQYNRIQKGYACPESMIGFMFAHGTVDYCMARCKAVDEYWRKGSSEFDQRIVADFLRIGKLVRTNYDFKNSVAVLPTG